MTIITWIAWMCVGFVVGYCYRAITHKTEADCINCEGLRGRDSDIASLTRSRDLFRDRCDQLEVKYPGLLTKMGLRAKVEQQAPFIEHRV